MLPQTPALAPRDPPRQATPRRVPGELSEAHVQPKGCEQ